MVEWFLGLFELHNLLYFIAGVAATLTWQYLRARFDHRHLVVHWSWMAAPLAVIVMLYVAVQTQQSADCIREFQVTLKERSRITTENDEVSQQQRELLYQWLHGVIRPPPEIAALPENDPRRREHLIRLTEAVDDQIGVLVDRQEEYDRERAARPLPEPSCGQ